MKISIVLSTYNGSQYIEEQLDSLRNQTYTVDEVLISDDCSQDNTVQIIETYIKKYELLNWELEVNEKNCGWRKNFMNLITSAMGDIVFTCDQDDIWSADKIQKMTQIMEENPEVLLLVSQYTEFYKNGYTKIMPKRKTKGYMYRHICFYKTGKGIY